MDIFQIHQQEISKINFPDSARIWLYQSDRQFTEAEVQQINQEGSKFSEQWNAHGTKLVSGVFVLHQFFVLVIADESYAGASGCSIDKSVHFIQNLGKMLQVDFFNRLNIAFITDSGIKIIHVNDLDEAFLRNEINAETLIFNPMIGSLTELKNNWLLPLNQSWAGSRISKKLNS